jgi:hypothetical protein
VRFQVIAVDDILLESEPAEVVLTPRAAAVAPATEVQAMREDSPGAPIIVTWQYGSEPVLGFRIYDRELLLVDEKSLGPETRSWSDETLVPGWEHRYAVVAVSQTGTLSRRSEAPPIRVPEAAVVQRPARPSGLEGTWIDTPRGPAIRLRWEPAPPQSEVVHYAFAADTKTPGAFVRLADTATSADTEYVFYPDGPLRHYAFHVFAVGQSGIESPAADLEVASPSVLLSPGRLRLRRVVHEGALTRLEWEWRYAELPVLKGFRIYQNDHLAVDEQTLGPVTRTWTTVPLPIPAIYRFRLEAVLLDGTASPRGPEAVYRYEAR